MICPECHTDNPSQARYCFNCGNALVQRCTNCDSELPPQAHFCMFCGEPVLVQTRQDESRFHKLASATPDELAKKLRAASPLSGERRQVTVLLIDVVDSTSLESRISEPAWSEILNETFIHLTPAIYRYEGTIARLLGDSVLAFFGAPVTHEDDPLRAVNAALEALQDSQQYIQQIQTRYNLPFNLRACLHSGEIEIGPLRENLALEYTSSGDTVNLVSRLKFAAGPGTVVISEDTYRFISPLFNCLDLGQIEVKGERDQVSIYQVLGRKLQPGSLRGLAGLESPLVGRDQELATLVRLCETVRAGLGRAVLITGEPGMGKTRLVSEWQLRIQDLEESAKPRWTVGRCLSYSSTTAYFLLVDWLHNVLGIKEGGQFAEIRNSLNNLLAQVGAEIDPGLRPVYSHLLGLPLSAEEAHPITRMDPETLRTQYQMALLQLVRGLAHQQPLVIILEDLHWADPSSIEVFGHLLPLVNEHPILLCMVTREDQDSSGWRLVTAAQHNLRDSLAEIHLNPLLENESRQMVTNLLSVDELPEQTRQLILQKSEGNPLFVEEIIRMLIERSLIVPQNGGWVAGKEIVAVDIPDNLQNLLMARIDRLPEEVRETLRVASVIGRQFPVKVLAEVLEKNLSDEPANPP
jgi:class 3 adenylate cyclase